MALPKWRHILSASLNSQLSNGWIIQSTRHVSCAVIQTPERKLSRFDDSHLAITRDESSLRIARRTFHASRRLYDITYKKRMQKVLNETKGRRLSDADAELRFTKRERQVKNMPDFDKIIESRGGFPEDALSPVLLETYLDGKLAGEGQRRVWF